MKQRSRSHVHGRNVHEPSGRPPPGLGGFMYVLRDNMHVRVHFGGTPGCFFKKMNENPLIVGLVEIKQSLLAHVIAIIHGVSVHMNKSKSSTYTFVPCPRYVHRRINGRYMGLCSMIDLTLCIGLFFPSDRFFILILRCYLIIYYVNNRWL